MAEPRKKDLSSQKKQQRVALDTLRNNKLCVEEEKHKSSPANVGLITIIKKVGYRMDGHINFMKHLFDDPENYKVVLTGDVTISPIG